MADLGSTSLTRQLGALFEGGSAAGLSDRQLLERFADGRDPGGEAAFAALVARHGPMVLAVCRDLLGDHQHAEDAFQAVFLVLARKARAIRDPERLGNWLHGVSLRTARKSRRRLARRRSIDERGALERPEARPALQAERAIGREQAEALHVEIGRLPVAFRAPVLLCYFEGLSLDEAAARLRWPSGTLRSRLARAREKLRRGLARRGFTLSTPALGSATVSPLLCETMTRAAIAFAARHAADGAISAPAASLAREALRSMLIHEIRLLTMTVLFLGALAAGSLTRTPARDDIRRAPSAPARPADPDRPAPGRMFVVGRVLGPDGKPVPNATVGITVRRKLLFAGGGSEGAYPSPSGRGVSDAEGRFRVDAPRTSSAHHAGFVATAMAPGHGVGWAEFDPDEDRPSADIALQPEQVIEGRLFDVQGRPAPAGVVVSVWSIWRPLSPIVLARGRITEPRWEGVTRWWARAQDGPGWPKPATTDADGRFTLRGIGRGLEAGLSVLDPRLAPQTLEVATDAPAGVKTFKGALLPARVLTGRVTYADTGRPAARAEVHVGGGVGRGGVRYVMTEADADGRFRIRFMPGDRLYVWAAAPDDQPYRHAARELAWPKEMTEQSVDLALPRGAMLRGRVTEEGTGRPVADALVDFFPSAPRPARTADGGSGRTKADGSFAFAVGHHTGHLSVQAPGEDYQLQVISSARFYDGTRAGGLRLYAHAFLPYDPGQGAGPPEVNVALRPGATVKFHLIGPDGRPARDVRVYSRAVLGPSAVSGVRTWPGATTGEDARRGHFEVHGLDETTEVPVHFLQPESRLGATARVSGKMAAAGPITVRLGPCGQAMMRLVGPDGRPVAGLPPSVSITMVATPGPPNRSAPVIAGALAADEEWLARVDPVNHGSGLIPDAQGRITLPALIPGAIYRIIDRGAGRDSPQVREFVVEPGQAIELGDVLVQNPRR